MEQTGCRRVASTARVALATIIQTSQTAVDMAD
jgi:hypothetical protein